MAKLEYIYKLALIEIEEYHKIKTEQSESKVINWINEQLQKAFDNGRKHPIGE